MPDATLSKNLSVAGIGIQSTFSKTADFAVPGQPTLAAGYAGSWVDASDKVTADTASHGITDTDLVAIFWDDPTTGDPKQRYDIEVTDVTGADITVDDATGDGDDFPADGTTVVISKRVAHDVRFDAADMAALLVGCSQRCVFQFYDGTDTFSAVIVAGGSYEWLSGQGSSNPLTEASVGSVTHLYLYAGSATETTVPFGALLTGSVA